MRFLALCYEKKNININMKKKIKYEKKHNKHKRIN